MMEKMSNLLRRLSGEISLTHDPESLLYAALNGSVGKVRSLIESGVDVNYKDQENATALIAAAEKGHSKVVRDAPGCRGRCQY